MIKWTVDSFLYFNYAHRYLFGEQEAEPEKFSYQANNSELCRCIE